MPQARAADPVAPDPQAHPDSPARPHGRSADISSLENAKCAHQVQAAHQAQEAQTEAPARTDHPEALVMTALPALLAQPDHLALAALMAETERRDQPDPVRKAHNQHPVTPVPLVRTDPQAQLADPVNQVPTVDPAQQDPRDHPAQLVAQAKMEAPATRDHLAQMATLASVVSVPSTALPMVVSSSRMVPDDKQQDTSISDWHATYDNPHRPHTIFISLFCLGNKFRMLGRFS